MSQLSPSGNSWLAKGRRWASLPALHHWVKGPLRTGICCCLPIFCCYKLFYSESWVSTILRLAQKYPEEYEAVSTFFPSSLMNMSWSTDPQRPSPSMEEHSGPSKAPAVPAHIPRSLLAWLGCGKSSADVFVLAPGCAHDANTPGLLLIQGLLSAGHLPVSWHSLDLGRNSATIALLLPRLVGQRRCCQVHSHTSVMYFAATQNNYCSYWLTIFPALQECLIPTAFLWCFWNLHASGSFFFPPQVHLKNKPVRISSISSVPWFWFLQQTMEQIFLWAFVC